MTLNISEERVVKIIKETEQFSFSYRYTQEGDK